MGKDTGGPAFPQAYEHVEVLARMHKDGELDDAQLKQASRQLAGMTLRQYAAIKLRVPNSGTDWLDEMIEKSLLDDLAGKAMQGLIHHFDFGTFSNDPMRVAGWAYDAADAMLKARGQA